MHPLLQYASLSQGCGSDIQHPIKTVRCNTVKQDLPLPAPLIPNYLSRVVGSSAQLSFQAPVNFWTFSRLRSASDSSATDRIALDCVNSTLDETRTLYICYFLQVVAIQFWETPELASCKYSCSCLETKLFLSLDFFQKRLSIFFLSVYIQSVQSVNFVNHRRCGGH